MIYLTGLDTETTGLKVEKGNRIIEICCQVFSWPERKKVINMTQRFTNQGVKMEPKAQAVHGISAADLVGKPRFDSFAPKLSAIFKKSKVIVAHNAMFDMGFLAHHMAEAGHPLPEDLIIYDTMNEGMMASYDSKPPSLREFCWAMGVEYNEAEAHAADYDVDVMMAAFFIALDRGYMELPANLVAKEAA